MKISVICFSMTGCETAKTLKKGLESAGMEVELSKKSRYLEDSVKESIRDWAGKRFKEQDALIFIGACGIAVRSIAPYVVGKKTDPAVLVIDECGRFVISLLSGHLGGANELAAKTSEILGATPVITTATDLHDQFAVDVFAKKNGCSIFRMKAAKEVSAALLAGEPVGFYSEFPWEGDLPKGLILCDREGHPVGKNEEKQSVPEVGIAVTVHENAEPFSSVTHVVPRIFALGIGCRKGKDTEGIIQAAEHVRKEMGIYPEAFCQIASIDLKKEEPGILALSEKYGIPFITYTEEELLKVSGEFTASSFVKKITGVDNVCERSAVLGSGSGTLVQKKKAADGVTTAVAAREWRVHF